MKKLLKIILFALIITIIVAIIVFTNANNQPSGPMSNLTQTPSVVVPGNISQSKISSSDLASHNKQADCWISYKGKVYDITSFLPKHPGSAAAISPYCGTSSEFEAAFQGQHGTSQVNKLIAEGIYKGDLA